MSKNYIHINDDLLVKYMLDEASPEEQHQVREWLSASADNRLYYDQLLRVWKESRRLAMSGTADEDAAWKRLRNRMHPVPVKKISARWMVAAAVLFIVAAAGWLLYTSGGDSMPVLTAQTTEEVMKDTLPDGSMITLNKNSSLQYPERFKGKKRLVRLKGEAFFEVKADREKPFIIAVNDVEVQVVGTSFNIKTNGSATEVIVETGVVQVKRGKQTVMLRAGEKMEINPKDTALQKTSADDRLYNYYRTRTFVCDETPLWKLVEVLNKAYDAQIVFGNPSIKNLQLTTTFSDESLDRILGIISETLGVTVEKEGNRIILR